ncbi:MAG: 50S ribosomal protein L35 [Deltaproteobacteria bacterium]|nr:50S ribosomal protein L35 [Deltaproteobacteria bacterium]
MPKLKTNRGAAKRFKVTAKGGFKHRRAFRSHILTSKVHKRKRQLRQPGMVDATNLHGLRVLLPYA